MAVNKLKVMLSFMRELNDGNIPKAKDYGITKDEYMDIIFACQNAGLISGTKFQLGKGQQIIQIITNNTKLTVKGLEYLDQHSAAMRTYKGLTELQDWLPF